MLINRGDVWKRGVRYDVEDWAGWSKFLELYENYKDSRYPDESRLCFLALFETGCRLNEAIELRPDQFKFNEYAIVCQRAPVLKKKTRAVRDIFIKLDEANPLGYEFRKEIEKSKTKYLLPSRTPFSRDIRPDHHMSDRTLYNRINEIHPKLFPHALRAYRASMLVYERGFSVQDLVSWFNWENAEEAIRYSATRDMASAMGLSPDQIPR